MRYLATLTAVLALAGAAATGARAQPALGCTVNVWIGGETYSGAVVRSINTSCPFARRVTAASLRFVVVHGGAGNGDFYVTVWSPVTYRWYRMHCYANGDINNGGIRVDCRGGIGARVVYIAH